MKFAALVAALPRFVLVEFGVTVGFAERLLQDFYPIPWRTRRQDKRRAAKPERALKAARACAPDRFGRRSRSREFAASEDAFSPEN
jgi:uncharacterized iron-regulated membrane protein